MYGLETIERLNRDRSSNNTNNGKNDDIDNKKEANTKLAPRETSEASIQDADDDNEGRRRG